MGSARQAENPHASTQIKWPKLKGKEKHGVGGSDSGVKTGCGEERAGENKVNG